MLGGGKGSYLDCTKLGSKADPSVSVGWGREPLPQRHLVLGCESGTSWVFPFLRLEMPITTLEPSVVGGAKYSLDPPLG